MIFMLDLYFWSAPVLTVSIEVVFILSIKGFVKFVKPKSGDEEPRFIDSMKFLWAHNPSF